MKIDNTRDHCITIRLPVARRIDWMQPVLLISDPHMDHPWADRAGILAVLDRAKAIGAPVLINGDALCLMQGPHDRRATGGMRLPAHDRPDYFDAVIDWFCQIMEPYKDIIAMYGSGNHETSIVRHHGTSPVRRICERMKIAHGNYHGYVLFRFEATGKSGYRRTVRMYRHHGIGNGGKQTGATLPLRDMRQAAEADIYWCGHTHHAGAIPTSVMQCSDAGVVAERRILSVSTPSWKNEWLRPGGWAIERGMGPKPLGAYWLKFRYRPSDSTITYTAEPTE